MAVGTRKSWSHLERKGQTAQKQDSGNSYYKCSKHVVLICPISIIIINRNKSYLFDKFSLGANLKSTTTCVSNCRSPVDNLGSLLFVKNESTKLIIKSLLHFSIHCIKFFQKCAHTHTHLWPHISFQQLSVKSLSEKMGQSPIDGGHQHTTWTLTIPNRWHWHFIWILWNKTQFEFPF